MSPEVPPGFPLSKEQQIGKPWSCRWNTTGCERTAPCRHCLGARSRRKGMTKQRKIRRELGVPDAHFSSQLANEEAWNGGCRVEVKAGKVMANPVWTRFLKAEAQSEASRPIGDGRPFLAVFAPDGTSESLIVFRTSQLRAVIEGLLSGA